MWNFIIPAIGTIAGILQGRDAAKKAAKAEDRAATAQERAQALDEKKAAEAEKFRQEMLAMHAKLKAEGQWDVGSQLQSAKSLLQRDEGNAMENVSAAMKTAGYKPGDTALETGLAGVRNDYGRQLQEIQQELSRMLPAQEAQMLDMANPMRYETGQSAGLRSDVGASLAMADRSRAQVPSPSALLGALMPYIEQQQAGREAQSNMRDWTQIVGSQIGAAQSSIGGL